MGEISKLKKAPRVQGNGYGNSTMAPEYKNIYYEPGIPLTPCCRWMPPGESPLTPSDKSRSNCVVLYWCALI